MGQVDRLSNLYRELRLGIRTRGVIESDQDDDEHVHYATVRYRMIDAILDHLALSPDDTFVDLGCGRGRVLCCAALRGPARAIGVELSPAVAALARDNTARLKPRHGAIEIMNIDATAFDYSIGTVYYLFNPFGPNTLRRVLEELGAGLERSPRAVRIVYVNPLHDDVLEGFPWLQRGARWERDGDSLEHHVQWWETTSPPSQHLRS